jgi:hypothetical protein
MKSFKLAKKSDKECEQEIDNIMNGKNRSRNAWIVRRFIDLHRKLGEPDHYIREMLIREYKIKYGLLQEKKITPEELLKQSQDDLKKVSEGKVD